MSWFAAIIFYNITSIGEVKSSSDGAKGLRFHDFRKAWIHSSGVLVFTKKEEWRKIETTSWKLKRNFKPKNGEILL
jgi:hypothetical protein